MVIAAALLAVAAPAAAAREPVTATDLAQVAEISGPTLSPDGRRVAFRVSQPSIEANRITLDWYVGDVDGDPPVHAASGGDARIDGAGLIADQTPIWDQDSRGFRFLALNEGEVTLWHWRDGQGAREEIRNEADLLDFAVSDDGELIRYTIGATRRMIADAQLAAYDEGVLVDASVDLNQAIAGGIIENGKRFMQRFSGPWFDRKPLLWDAPRRDIVVAADNSPQPAAAAEAFRPRQISAAQGASVTSADGSRADIERENGDTRLVVTRPDGRRTMCNAPTCGSPRLLAVAWRPGHDTLLLFVAEGSAREGVWLWRVGAARARKLAVTDGALRLADRPLRCAVSASALTCAESTPLVPPRLVSINLESGKRRATFEPNAALAARIDAEATPLELSGGYSAVLLRPQGAKVPPPVVVQNYHCAGFLKGGTGEELPMLPLAEHGIAVLCIDPFRGPPGSGTDGTYELARKVIASAIDDLGKRKLIDPDRVGIAGFSHSSGVALWAIRHGADFKAATIGTGQISPHYFWTNAVPDRGFEAMLKDYWNIGDPDTDPARWRTASTVFNIGAIDTPILMQLPDAEAPWTAELHTKLKRAGKPAEMVVYADELHNKYQPRHKRAVYDRNLDWFRFWLTGEEDPAPGKSEQYERWRHYRAGQPLPAPAR
ncbi:MAG: Atxe2 family lasso peptide isopeptidase [Sphingopyxis sp.]|nr:Atxe2 family lasso peptide isopeptidase [Sphingopyxis sp.]